MVLLDRLFVLALRIDYFGVNKDFYHLRGCFTIYNGFVVSFDRD
jgi:hypothetical protein